MSLEVIEGDWRCCTVQVREGGKGLTRENEKKQKEGSRDYGSYSTLCIISKGEW